MHIASSGSRHQCRWCTMMMNIFDAPIVYLSRAQNFTPQTNPLAHISFYRTDDLQWCHARGNTQLVVEKVVVAAAAKRLFERRVGVNRQ